MDDDVNGEVRARIPADVDAPDRVLFGLTERQVAVLVCVAAPAYLAWRALAGRIPDQILIAAGAPVAALAVGLALGRRDGIGLDAWLTAAVRHRCEPHRLAPAAQSPAEDPAWSPLTAAPPPPAPLRLPAEAIDVDGVIEVGEGRSVAVVATTTVNTGLLAGAEQAGLVETYARWLNSLTGPVQVVVSTRRVDLGGPALRAARAAGHLPSPALQAAARGYARFLLDLTEDRNPLARTVTITCTATSGDGPPSGWTAPSPQTSSRSASMEAERRAARTAQALAGLGVRAVVLDDAAVTALLTAAVDPYTPCHVSWRRIPPDQPVTRTGRSTSGPPMDGSW
jgi:hypothetical protein